MSSSQASHFSTPVNTPPHGSALSAGLANSAVPAATPSKKEGFGIEQLSNWQLTFGLPQALGLAPPAITLPSASYRLAQTEVEIARVFNQALPQSPMQALDLLEEAIGELMGVQQQLILWALPEPSDAYRCLNDERQSQFPPREVHTLDDETLSTLLGTPHFLQSPLVSQDVFYGLLLVANKNNAEPFTLDDQMTLDILAPYVVTQVQTYQQLSQSGRCPFVQASLLHLLGQLVGLVETQAILQEALSFLLQTLGFDTAHYLQWNPQHSEEAWLSLILTEQQGFPVLGEMATPLPEGALLPLLDLFRSKAWSKQSVLLHGDPLKEFTLTQTPAYQAAKTVLFVPIRQKESGELLGLMAFLSHSPEPSFAKTLVTIAEEAAPLISAALERAAVLDKAIQLANRDELTGLANRRRLYERFELELSRLERTAQPLSLAMLDVDNFKRINDTHGHLIGDTILETLAHVLQANTRNLDMVARFGGEEFVLLLPNTPLLAAQELMDRLRSTIAGMPFTTQQGEPLHITVSIGVTTLTKEALLASHALATPVKDEATTACLKPLEESSTAYSSSSKKQLVARTLAQADAALYRAKAAGRNQVCIATV